MDWTGRWSSCKQWEAMVGWATDMGGLKKGKRALQQALRRSLIGRLHSLLQLRMSTLHVGVVPLVSLISHFARTCRARWVGVWMWVVTTVRAWSTGAPSTL